MTQDLVQRVKQLDGMDVSELQAKYKEVLGEETISRNKKVLIDQIRRGLFSKDIKEKREARKKGTQAKADAGATADADQPPEKTIEELQRELNALTGRKVITRDRAVLNRMIAKLEKRQVDGAEAKAEAPTLTKRLLGIANMKLPALREEYQKLFGKPSLSRNRKKLLVKIAERLQADEAASEAATSPVAKPTLTVKFERKGKAKAGGKSQRPARRRKRPHRARKRPQRGARFALPVSGIRDCPSPAPRSPVSGMGRSISSGSWNPASSTTANRTALSPPSPSVKGGVKVYQVAVQKCTTLGSKIAL